MSPTPATPIHEQRLVVRTRLLEALRRRFDHPMTVIVGGPGSGKTTLLHQAVAENERSPLGDDVLFACDASHRAPARLATALAALVAIDPGPSPDSATLTHRALQAIAQRAPLGCALLLDDVHVLRASAGEALLRDALRDAPPTVHVVITSRTPVTWVQDRTGARMLDEQDLRFDDRELDDLARRRHVDPASLRSLDGWPAIADLAATLGIAGASAFVQDEVVDHLPHEVKRRLAIVAAVGDGDGAFRSVALDGEVPDPLFPPDIPLVRPERDRWAVHPLWRSLLTGTLAADEERAVRHRVSTHLLATGEPERAGALNLEAEDWPAFEDAVTSLWRRGYVGEGRDLLADWLDRLPSAQRNEPAGLLLRGAAARVRDSFGVRTRDLLAEIVDECRAQGSISGELVAIGEYAYVCRARAEVDRLLPVMARLVELAGQGHDEMAPFVTLTEATMTEMMGDDHKVLALLDTLADDDLSPEWMTAASYLRVQAAWRLGDTDNARRAARDCARFGPRSPLGRFIGPLAAWFMGEPDQGAADLPDLADEANLTRVEQLMLGARVAVVLAGRGQVAQARRAVALSRAAAVDLTNPAVAVETAVAAAAVAVAEGDEATAAAQLTAVIDELEAQTAERLLRTSIAMVYVLAPGLRSRWDGAELGPMLVGARAAAQVLMDLRAADPARVDETPRTRSTPVWPSTDALITGLGLRWATEVACRAHDAGLPRGAEVAVRLLTLLGNDARAALRALAGADNGGSPKPAASPEPGAGAGAGPVQRGAQALLSHLTTAPEAPMELALLGPTRLRQHGHRLEHPNLDRPMVRTLLAYLAMHGSTVRRRVAQDLWPDADEQAATHNLRTHVGLLVSVLEPDRLAGEASFMVVNDGDRLGLATDDYLEVDVRRFDAAIGSVPTDAVSDDDVDALHRALSLWRGAPLVDLAPLPWVEQQRDRLQRAVVRAGLGAGRYNLANGGPSEAVARAIDALQVDPWNEEAYQLLVAAHLANGDRAAAHRALHRCRLMLAELEVPPAPQTAMLERRLRLPVA